ncbi:hypothetical protein FGO68_gene14176 [Halteria grandinella]|uniref:Uncharacterized protein n=1 Tax=Halteria grandinella TaxID=5974 RepID=A0A8J8P8D5_HALGN|nr:hypothetical protein FGO68_gene14176 [Halteria grandinella]
MRAEEGHVRNNNINNIEILRLRINETAFIKTMMTVFEGTHAQHKDLYFKMQVYQMENIPHSCDRHLFTISILTVQSGFKRHWKDQKVRNENLSISCTLRKPQNFANLLLQTQKPRHSGFQDLFSHYLNLIQGKQQKLPN